MSRGEQLQELASDLTRAAETARRIGLPTTVYLLSMALMEVKEAFAAAGDGDDDGAA